MKSRERDLKDHSSPNKYSQKDNSQKGNGPFFLPNAVQAKLKVASSKDSFEIEAEQKANQFSKNENSNKSTTISKNTNTTKVNAKLKPPKSGNEKIATSTSNQKLDGKTNDKMESFFNADFSDVRIHSNPESHQLNESIQAKAFTHGTDIYFNKGEYNPNTAGGSHLLAHELTHVVQQRPANQVNRATGKDAQARATTITSQHDNLKAQTDVVKSALKEIKAGTSVNTNSDLIKKNQLPKIAPLLGLKLADLTSEWNALVADAKNKTFDAKKTAFLAKITNSTLSSIKTQFPKSHAHDWIRNTDASVFDIIIKHADADITADQLYAYASNEGLSLLIKGSGKTGAKLVADPVSGFGYLGLDDFMTDYNAKRKPLSGYLPAGFDKKITPSDHVNEKGRTVHSANFPNLDSALQGAKAMLKRRRDLFLEDAKANGYATPTTDEKVFWTYLYYNPGEFAGKGQLEKYKTGNTKKLAVRKLGDWISKGEYPDAQRVLQGYQAVKKMKLFV